MFYPTQEDVTIKQGDYVAAACTMYNSRSHVVRIGYDVLVLGVNEINFCLSDQPVMMKCVIFI